MASSPPHFGVAEVDLTITINASPTKVWQAMVHETSSWWSKDFYTSPDAKGFIIEPMLGGKAYEDWGEGAGQTWYTVIGVQPESMLMMQGFLTSAFGGPATTILHLTLTPQGKKTVLHLTDTIFGQVGDDKKNQTRDGWMMLFEAGLKAYVEAK